MAMMSAQPLPAPSRAVQGLLCIEAAMLLFVVQDAVMKSLLSIYPVWPLHEITPDGTPELARAAHRALAVRGDENLSAHGSLHRTLVAARLRDADRAAANLRKIICADMFFRSLMSAHNPGLQTYNADAVHTLPGVLIEMLVDSRPGSLHLLPAWPGELPGGTLRGVTCRGRITVEELTWDATTLRVRLRSALSQQVAVRSPYGARAVDLPADEPVELSLHT